MINKEPPSFTLRELQVIARNLKDDESDVAVGIGWRIADYLWHLRKVEIEEMLASKGIE